MSRTIETTSTPGVLIKDSLHITWLFDSGQTSGPDVFGNLLLGTFAQRQTASNEESHVFTPSAVNFVRVGLNRVIAEQVQALSAINPVADDPSYGFLPGRDIGQTLNLGLRYEMATVPTEAHDLLGTFVPGSQPVWVRSSMHFLFRTALQWDRDWRNSMPAIRTRHRWTLTASGSITSLPRKFIRLSVPCASEDEDVVVCNYDSQGYGYSASQALSAYQSASRDQEWTGPSHTNLVEECMRYIAWSGWI